MRNIPECGRCRPAKRSSTQCARACRQVHQCRYTARKHIYMRAAFSRILPALDVYKLASPGSRAELHIFGALTITLQASPM